MTSGLTIECAAKAGYEHSMKILDFLHPDSRPKYTWETENESCKEEWREKAKIMLAAIPLPIICKDMELTDEQIEAFSKPSAIVWMDAHGDTVTHQDLYDECPTCEDKEDDLMSHDLTPIREALELFMVATGNGDRTDIIYDARIQARKALTRLEAIERSPQLPCDEQLIAKMLLACSDLEDLNDCMTAALRVLKPYLRRDPMGDAGNLSGTGTDTTAPRAKPAPASPATPSDAPYHIERDAEGYEVLVLHAVDETDEEERWIREGRLATTQSDALINMLKAHVKGASIIRMDDAAAIVKEFMGGASIGNEEVSASSLLESPPTPSDCREAFEQRVDTYARYMVSELNHMHEEHGAYKVHSAKRDWFAMMLREFYTGKARTGGEKV